jgi:hypothetical protein
LDNLECKCNRWASKVLEPIRVSHSRIIYRCRQCDGVVCWSDDNQVIPEKVKIRPKLEGYSEALLNDLI